MILGSEFKMVNPRNLCAVAGPGTVASSSAWTCISCEWSAAIVVNRLSTPACVRPAYTQRRGLSEDGLEGGAACIFVTGVSVKQCR